MSRGRPRVVSRIGSVTANSPRPAARNMPRVKSAIGAVTTGGVSQAAGIQAPTIYRLFGDKDGLLDAVAEHVMATYVSTKAAIAESAASANTDPLDDLRDGWNMQVDFGLCNPTLFRLLSSPERGLHFAGGAARRGSASLPGESGRPSARQHSRALTFPSLRDQDRYRVVGFRRCDAGPNTLAGPDVSRPDRRPPCIEIMTPRNVPLNVHSAPKNVSLAPECCERLGRWRGGVSRPSSGGLSLLRGGHELALLAVFKGASVAAPGQGSYNETGLRRRRRLPRGFSGRRRRTHGRVGRVLASPRPS
jgi:hypothetical protein